MSRRAPPTKPQPSRLTQVLQAGQEQQKAKEAAPSPTSGAPYFYVGKSSCKKGVYCSDGTDDAKDKDDDDDAKDVDRLADLNPAKDAQNYISRVMANPDRWEANGLLMLKPGNFSSLDGAPFKRAFDAYDIEQPGAVQRGTTHSTAITATDGSALGEITNVEGTQDAIYRAVVASAFVDGNGPIVAPAFTLRIYLQNRAGKRLGTLFALGKRAIEANAPSRDDLEYYLFVDLSEEWSVDGDKMVAVDDAVNQGAALWNEQLHDALEFASFRSVGLLADQFVRE